MKKDNFIEDKLNFKKTLEAFIHFSKVRMELFETESKEYLAQVIISFLVLISIMGLLFVFLFFFSLAGAFLLNSFLNSTYAGFLIVAGLIILFGILLYVFRAKLVTNIVYKLIFENDTDVFKDIDE